MSLADAEALHHIVAQLKQKRDADVSLADISALASAMVEALHSYHGSVNSNIQRELRDIAGYIARLRQEIGALRPNELHRVHIPAAGHELAAIVQITEAATNSIMERAEMVMSVELMDFAAYKAFVNARMLAVIEACSFQDITGQRVAKVVETLEQIERRIARFASETRVADAEGYASEQEAERAGRRQRLLLNGPSAGVDANGQADIDFVLAAGKPTVTQAEIDMLFARPEPRPAPRRAPTKRAS